MKNILSLLFVICLSTFVACARSEGSNIGKMVDLSKVEFIQNKVDIKGSPAIVEFWATWCPPCRASIPHMNEIYNEYKGKGLKVVGISDEATGTIQNFAKGKIDYAVGRDAGGAMMRAFGIDAIPHAMLVSKEGKVVWEGHPMELEKAEIEKILK
jgi:thiol-disulfide isomerase/thioredoxin